MQRILSGLVFTICICFYLPGAAQPYDIEELRNYINDLLDAKDADSIRLHRIDSCILLIQSHPNDSLLALAYHRKGNLYYNAKPTVYENAAEYFNLAFELRKTIPSFPVTETARSAYWAGRAAQFSDNLQLAEQYYTKVTNLRPINEFTTNAFRVWANMHLSGGNVPLARKYMELAFDIQESLSTKDRFTLYADEIGISFDQNDQASLDESMRRKGLLLPLLTANLNSEKPNEIQAGSYYLNLGALFSLHGQIDSSIIYYQKVIDIYRSITQVPRAYNNIANEYRKKRQFKQAEENLKKALEIYLDGNKFQLTAGTYDNFGDLFLDQNDFRKALENYDLAVQHLLEAENLTVSEVKSKIPLLAPTILGDLQIYLKDKATALSKLARHSDNKALLTQSLELYNVCDQITDVVRLRFPQDEANVFWRGKAREIYEPAIQTALFADSISKAIQLIEKGKSLVLYESLLRIKARDLIPGILNDSLKLLRSEITLAQNHINDLKSENLIDSTKILHAQNDLLQKSQQLITFTDSLRVWHPKYYQSFQSRSFIDLSSFQNGLKNNETFLTYYFVQDSLVCARIDSKEIEIQTLAPSLIVEGLMGQYVDLMTNTLAAFQGTESTYLKHLNKLSNVTHQLFTILIKPFDTLPQIITIIPDRDLHLLNFDQLLVSPNSANSSLRDASYLIHKHCINYASSLQTWQEVSLIKSTGSLAVGFAPDFAESAYIDLPYNDAELGAMKRYYRSTSYTAEDASRDNLLLEEADIIHLATHGVLNQ
jgi:tetratricopeptide (TPR) repeat protein